MKVKKMVLSMVVATIGFFTLSIVIIPVVSADYLPGGTLDPTTIPKYVTPLVIPPVMNDDGEDEYEIAVREFKQQILPGGIWDTVADPTDIYPNFPATPIWSYGPEEDDLPDSTALGGAPGVAPAPNSQFNYPAYTIETRSNHRVDVEWINDLTEDFGDSDNCLEHLLPIDQTVHWANPPMECREGDPRTDCAGTSQEHYIGPVPIITHVHGAHVGPESDGYPEAWFLPDCDIPEGYATSGTLFDDVTGDNDGSDGEVEFSYPNDQPATTLWYHDHTLGMTRLNVYAGPAGFWLIRGGKYDKIKDTSTGKRALLPGPAPVAGDTVLALNVPGDPVRNSIREIPIVIQDRSFNEDGTLFYPANRAFFEGLGDGQVYGVEGNWAAALELFFSPDTDVLPTWNPEAFFNVMVVNGVSWPSLDIAPARYRFRLLNGCNSRFLNLAMFVVTGPGTDGIMGTADDDLGDEIPFFQIGAEQGFLRKVAMVSTGFATKLPGNGTIPAPVSAPDPAQALLMGLAERADVIVDFSELPDGTVVRMINTAPDEPFGGGFDPPADPGTSGQVMQFVVSSALLKDSDAMTTSPFDMKPKAEKRLKKADNRRKVSLNEVGSEQVLVCANADEEFAIPIIQVSEASECPDDFPYAVEFGPTEALLGTVNGSGTGATGNPLKWTDESDPANIPVNITLNNGNMVTVNVTEKPELGDTEVWDIYNFTEDAHPIHLHLVRFEVKKRKVINADTSPLGFDRVQPWESGYKDTVIAYPGQLTRIKAKFDVPGLYVWHCHIVEHEDNEMMRPYYVGE